MAMYENLGFCPANSFGYNYPENNDAALWARTKELLSDRIGFMVYDHNAIAWGRQVCSAVDVFRFGGESTLGLEIACALQHYIPVCSYADSIGKKILIKDIINPNQAPLQVTDSEGNGMLMTYAGADLAKVKLFQDERYFVEMTEVGDEVHMYVFKKN